MSITPSTPVLHSNGDTAMRLDDASLHLTQVNREHRIPLKAIADVRAEGRGLAVTLKARWEDEPSVFRIGGVDEDAAVAFAQAVTEALPEPAEGERDVNGAAVVVSRDLVADSVQREGLNGFQIGAIVILVAIAGLAIYAGIMGGIWPAVAVVIVGGVAAFFLAGAVIQIPDTALAWSLPKRGVTAVATFSHVGEHRRLHLYLDRQGNTRSFPGLYASTSAWAPKDINVVYDPENPHIVLRADEGRWGKAIGLAFMGAISAVGLAGTVLIALGYL